MADKLNDGAAQIGGTARARTRPDTAVAPEHWVRDAPPNPAAMEPVPAPDQPEGRDPVRYGDWELKGIAVDF